MSKRRELEDVVDQCYLDPETRERILKSCFSISALVQLLKRNPPQDWEYESLQTAIAEFYSDEGRSSLKEREISIKDESIIQTKELNHEFTSSNLQSTKDTIKKSTSIPFTTSASSILGSNQAPMTNTNVSTNQLKSAQDSNISSDSFKEILCFGLPVGMDLSLWNLTARKPIIQSYSIESWLSPQLPFKTEVIKTFSDFENSTLRCTSSKFGISAGFLGLFGASGSLHNSNPTSKEASNKSSVMYVNLTKTVPVKSFNLNTSDLVLNPEVITRAASIVTLIKSFSSNNNENGSRRRKSSNDLFSSRSIASRIIKDVYNNTTTQIAEDVKTTAANTQFSVVPLSTVSDQQPSFPSKKPSRPNITVSTKKSTVQNNINNFNLIRKKTDTLESSMRESERYKLQSVILNEAEGFLIDFYSHLPLGLHHIGGTFTKTIKIRSATECTIDELESAWNFHSSLNLDLPSAFNSAAFGLPSLFQVSLPQPAVLPGFSTPLPYSHNTPVARYSNQTINTSELGSISFPPALPSNCNLNSSSGRFPTSDRFSHAHSIPPPTVLQPAIPLNSHLSVEGSKTRSTGSRNLDSSYSVTADCIALGPPTADENDFVSLLLESPSTWRLIDRGDDRGLVAVWELLKEWSDRHIILSYSIVVSQSIAFSNHFNHASGYSAKELKRTNFKMLCGCINGECNECKALQVNNVNNNDKGVAQLTDNAVVLKNAFSIKRTPQQQQQQKKPFDLQMLSPKIQSHIPNLILFNNPNNKTSTIATPPSPKNKKKGKSSSQPSPKSPTFHLTSHNQNNLNFNELVNTPLLLAAELRTSPANNNISKEVYSISNSPSASPPSTEGFMRGDNASHQNLVNHVHASPISPFLPHDKSTFALSDLIYFENQAALINGALSGGAPIFRSISGESNSFSGTAIQQQPINMHSNENNNNTNNNINNNNINNTSKYCSNVSLCEKNGILCSSHTPLVMKKKDYRREDSKQSACSSDKDCFSRCNSVTSNSSQHVQTQVLSLAWDIQRALPWIMAEWLIRSLPITLNNPVMSRILQRCESDYSKSKQSLSAEEQEFLPSLEEIRQRAWTKKSSIGSSKLKLVVVDLKCSNGHAITRNFPLSVLRDIINKYGAIIIPKSWGAVLSCPEKCSAVYWNMAIERHALDWIGSSTVCNKFVYTLKRDYSDGNLEDVFIPVDPKCEIPDKSRLEEIKAEIENLHKRNLFVVFLGGEKYVNVPRAGHVYLKYTTNHKMYIELAQSFEGWFYLEDDRGRELDYSKCNQSVCFDCIKYKQLHKHMSIRMRYGNNRDPNSTLFEIIIFPVIEGKHIDIDTPPGPVYSPKYPI